MKLRDDVETFMQTSFWILLAISIVLLSLFLFRKQLFASQVSQLSKIDVEMIWDKAEHNAFTDLIHYKNAFYLSFRESDSHAGGENGRIRILKSVDGNSWQSAALLSYEGYDLRDPMLSEMPDGRLMLNMGASLYREGKLIEHHPSVSFSSNGAEWADVMLIEPSFEWIWRVSWHKGIGYGASYSFTDITDLGKPWELKLFSTLDGIHYDLITKLDVSPFPNEVTLRFLDDDRMVALVRKGGTGWIGHSPSPYTEWNWYDTGYRLGGPNFIIQSEDVMWASSRKIEKSWFGKLKFSVIIAKMGLTRYEPVLTLPSGGDCSYPGLVLLDNVLYVSYYSSHEGKSNIYFAKIDISTVE